MNAQVVLTPAESKRLIARAVAALPFVQHAMQNGVVAVAKGTTNSYVAEALLGHPIDKQRYVTGMRLPAHVNTGWIPEGRLPDIVLRKGEPVAGAVVTEMIKEMNRGDVLIKGANALESSRKMAAIYVGHNTGGTIGATIGTVVARGVRLVIPVGLEKLVSGSIADLAARFLSAQYEMTDAVGYMPVTGDIITEIEAFNLLFGVEALHTGSGGVGGAEGSTHFLLSGEPNAIKKATASVHEIYGEPAFSALGSL